MKANSFASMFHIRSIQNIFSNSVIAAVTIFFTSQVWKNYTWGFGFRFVCDLSYALLYYTPFVLSLYDCNFVRSTFTTITVSHCSPLGNDLKIVNVGFALVSVGGLLCLILWVLPQETKETFAQQVPVGKKPNQCTSPVGNEDQN